MITTYTGSDGTVWTIRQMVWRHLNATHAKLIRTGGDPEMIAALADEIARRERDEGRGAPADHTLPQADDDPPPAPPGHNMPPEPIATEESIEAFTARIEEQYRACLSRPARAEMAIGKLPAASEITTDAQIEQIDEWIAAARKVAIDLEKTHKPAKAPYLARGRVIDDLFNGQAQSLRERIAQVEKRKIPYLKAKADRAAAELAARQRAEREAALRLQEEADRQKAIADRAAEEQRAAAARLNQAESVRAVEEEVALASAEAADELPDLTLAQDLGRDVDSAEADMRSAAVTAMQAAGAAASLSAAAAATLEQAEATERALATPTHVLGKTGASSLRSVWKHRITGAGALMRSHPLIPFLLDSDLDAALKRAAKSEPRPVIPGVEFYEEFEATTARPR